MRHPAPHAGEKSRLDRAVEAKVHFSLLKNRMAGKANAPVHSTGVDASF